MVDLKQVNEAWTRYLRPQTFPVAIRMCESENELPDKVRIPQRDLGLTISLCHAVQLARRYGWTIAVDKQQSCWNAGLSLGFLPLLPDVVDGSQQVSLGLWGMTKEQAADAVKEMPKFEYSKYKYALIGPVDKANYEPHVIITYANPAQIWVLLSAYLYEDGIGGKLVQSLTTGGGCSTWLVNVMQTDEARFALVGTGERLGPNAQDYECALSIPYSKIERTVKGLENGYKDGVHRYPIPGMLRYNTQHPPGYDKMRSHLLGE